MNNYTINIHYLYHSGFSVETKNYFLIFDYYKDSFTGKTKNIYNGLISNDFIKSKNNVIVFSSHSHPDHFNPVILKWDKINKNIKYILSSDIKITNYKKNYYKLSKYKDLKLDDIYIKAYGSTDIGVSYLVKVDGITLFHAGDLNWWYWKDDSENERKMAGGNFKHEIKQLKGEKIDIAFFPVDPRLEEYYSLGGEYFIKEINPSVFFPMHLWDKMSICGKFKDYMGNCKTKIMCIENPGQNFQLAYEDGHLQLPQKDNN